MEVAKRMKEENIPASTIFIDYHYWGKYGTGSHKFDETIFPDVPAMVDSLHNMYDLKVVLTMWPSFKPGIPNYNEMSERGYILKEPEPLMAIYMILLIREQPKCIGIK